MSTYIKVTKSFIFLCVCSLHQKKFNSNVRCNTANKLAILHYGLSISLAVCEIIWRREDFCLVPPEHHLCRLTCFSVIFNWTETQYLNLDVYLDCVLCTVCCHVVSISAHISWSQLEKPSICNSSVTALWCCLQIKVHQSSTHREINLNPTPMSKSTDGGISFGKRRLCNVILQF